MVLADGSGPRAASVEGIESAVDRRFSQKPTTTSSGGADAQNGGCGGAPSSAPAHATPIPTTGVSLSDPAYSKVGSDDAIS